MLEIEDYTYSQTCDAQIVQHQSTLMVGDFVDYLGIYNNCTERDQSRNEKSNLLTLVNHVERRLLQKRNFSQHELDDQRIFIRLLYQPVTERVQNLNRTTDNLKHLFFQK